jgi:hypothetical protein
MFTQPKPNVIESDDGYSVEILGMAGLKYTEGERTMRIDSEMVPGPAGMVVFKRSIQHWDPPHQYKEVDEQSRSLIVENIGMALKFRGYHIDID